MGRYLYDNHISFHLSLRVRRFLDHFFNERNKKSHENNVEILTYLSEPLRMELHCEVYSPCVTKHPFFYHYSSFNLSAMQKLCYTAIKTVRLSFDDVLFNYGDVASSMYFIACGHFSHVQGEGEQNQPAENVSAGQWVSEMVLWTPWEHRGQMCSLADSTLIALDAMAFHDIVLQSKGGQMEASTYAFEAVYHLNACKDIKDLSDIDSGEFDSAAVAKRLFRRSSKGGSRSLIHMPVSGVSSARSS